MLVRKAIVLMGWVALCLVVLPGVAGTRVLPDIQQSGEGGGDDSTWPITLRTASDQRASWRFQQDYIVFDSNHRGNYDIWIAEPRRGGALTQITSPLEDDAFAVFSPDGSHIAFASNRSGNWDIYVQQVVLGGEGRPIDNARQLTTDVGDELHPAWSPDGSLIAFTSTRDGLRSVFVVPWEGGEAMRVTDGSMVCTNPTWGPCGQNGAPDRIAFQAFYDEAWNICCCPLNGGNMDQVVRGATQPAWSPRFLDGTSAIAFTVNEDGDAGRPVEPMVFPIDGDCGTPPAQSNIYMARSDGSGLEQLTFNSAGNRHPAWSPNGRFVVYTSDRRGNADIWIAPTGHVAQDPNAPVWGGRMAAVVEQLDAVWLSQNDPNPFNPTTRIRLQGLDTAGGQILFVNVRGQRVRTIPVDRGQESILWDGRSDTGLALPSGTYFYRFVSATGSTEPRKAILLR